MKAASLRVANVYLTRRTAYALRTLRRLKGAETGCVVFMSFVFVNGSVVIPRYYAGTGLSSSTFKGIG
jgi:hypothetical protein